MLFLHSSCRYSHYTLAWEAGSPAFFGETLKVSKGQAASGGMKPVLCLYICPSTICTAVVRGTESSLSVKSSLIAYS